MAKNKSYNNGIVYSTNPDFNNNNDLDGGEETHLTPNHEQLIKIQIDKKQRAGKVVTLIYGFDKNDAEIDEIGKKIKRFCGTGGSSKKGEVIIQGDFRTKALQWLQTNGFIKAKII